MQSDWEFCQTSLRAVSRTFSQPIEMLPDELRRAVTCGYLLCRVADTIEDDHQLALKDRDQRFATFLSVLHGDVEPREFEGMWRDDLGSPESEIALARRLHSVLNVLQSTPEAMQTIVLRWVDEMTRGMQIYSHRPAGSDGVVALSNPDDLQRYCYFVAGTVGHMLTELFVAWMGIDENDPTARALQQDAEAFGTGLQLVNILKDITDDLQRGWSFVPRTLCADHRLAMTQLADPLHRADAHNAIRPILDLAQERLDRALRYALAIPATQREIRVFCLLPLWMAVKTIVLAKGNDAMFATGQAVKISRQEVADVIRICTQHYDDDAFLTADYEAMWNAHPNATAPMTAHSGQTIATKEHHP